MNENPEPSEWRLILSLVYPADKKDLVSEWVEEQRKSLVTQEIIADNFALVTNDILASISTYSFDLQKNSKSDELRHEISHSFEEEFKRDQGFWLIMTAGPLKREVKVLS